MKFLSQSRSGLVDESSVPHPFAFSLAKGWDSIHSPTFFFCEEQ